MLPVGPPVLVWMFSPRLTEVTPGLKGAVTRALVLLLFKFILPVPVPPPAKAKVAKAVTRGSIANTSPPFRGTGTGSSPQCTKKRTDQRRLLHSIEKLRPRSTVGRQWRATRAGR